MSFLRFVVFYIAAVLVCTDQPVSFFQHDPAAPGASLRRRLLPAHKVALGISHASVILAALLGLSDDDVLAALGAGYADLLIVGLGVVALRESRTGKEFAVRPILDDHMPSAVLTDFFRLLLTASSRSG